MPGKKHRSVIYSDYLWLHCTNTHTYRDTHSIKTCCANVHAKQNKQEKHYSRKEINFRYTGKEISCYDNFLSYIRAIFQHQIPLF